MYQKNLHLSQITLWVNTTWTSTFLVVEVTWCITLAFSHKQIMEYMRCLYAFSSPLLAQVPQWPIHPQLGQKWLLPHILHLLHQNDMSIYQNNDKDKAWRQQWKGLEMHCILSPGMFFFLILWLLTVKLQIKNEFSNDDDVSMTCYKSMTRAQDTLCLKPWYFFFLSCFKGLMKGSDNRKGPNNTRCIVWAISKFLFFFSSNITIKSTLFLVDLNSLAEWIQLWIFYLYCTSA